MKNYKSVNGKFISIEFSASIGVEFSEVSEGKSLKATKSNLEWPFVVE